MNYKSKHQREDSNNLLKAIAEAGGLLTLSFIAPGAAPTLIKAYYAYGKIREDKLYQTVYRLSRNGLISIKESKDDEVILKLENKGQEKVLKMQIDDIALAKPEKWDGLWRIVIFDIPDQHKYARNLFREKITDLGFLEIQRSIYAHPYPCEDEIEMIRSIYEIRQYVKIITANYIEGEHKLLGKFGLAKPNNNHSYNHAHDHNLR